MNDGQSIVLSDVARIARESADRRAWFRGNGEPQLALGIIKTSTANALQVSRDVRAEIDRINPGLPEGMTMGINFDTTVFIDAAVKKVYSTLFEAIALVLLVIWLFLGSVRAALIPAVTVPVCLMAAFIALWLFGYSINLLTLLALVLCIGLVVDDAIVVLENAQRRIDAGEPPMLGGIPWHPPGRFCRHCHHGRIGGGIPADGVHRRKQRPPFPRTGGNDGQRHCHFGG